MGWHCPHSASVFPLQLTASGNKTLIGTHTNFTSLTPYVFLLSFMCADDMHMHTHVCICVWMICDMHTHVCVCKYVYTMVHMWRSENNLRCPSLTSTSVETTSLVFYCVCKASWPTGFWEFSCFHLSNLTVWVLRLQINCFVCLSTEHELRLCTPKHFLI